jgi:ERCC4-type nuclease
MRRGTSTSGRAAAHPDNTRIVTHLNKLHASVLRRQQEQYARTIKKATRSVLQCTHPITSVRDAQKLPGVGVKLAHVIMQAVGSEGDDDAGHVPSASSSASNVATGNAKRRLAAWNSVEDDVLVDGQQKLGNKWAKIAKLINARVGHPPSSERTGNDVKNRWHGYLKTRVLGYENAFGVCPRAPPTSTSTARATRPVDVIDLSQRSEGDEGSDDGNYAMEVHVGVTDEDGGCGSDPENFAMEVDVDDSDASVDARPPTTTAVAKIVGIQSSPDSDDERLEAFLGAKKKRTVGISASQPELGTSLADRLARRKRPRRTAAVPAPSQKLVDLLASPSAPPVPTDRPTMYPPGPPRTVPASGATRSPLAATSPLLQRSTSMPVTGLAKTRKWPKGSTLGVEGPDTPSPSAVWNRGRNGSASKTQAWEIVLLIDNREVRSSSDRVFFERALGELRVKCETRALPLGDFMWVKRSVEGERRGEDWVLDYIVERKNIDDLAASIVDKRYEEQKFRLSTSGLGRVIYLVEGDPGKISSHGPRTVSADSLRSAMTEVRVKNGFIVQQTSGVDGTVAYLADIHANITALNPPPVIKYSAFCQRSAKLNKQTISHVFGRQLVQVKMVSADRARAILQKYPTPRALMDAYTSKTLDRIDKAFLLEHLVPTNSTTRVGPKLSEALYRTFNDDYLPVTKKKKSKAANRKSSHGRPKQTAGASSSTDAPHRPVGPRNDGMKDEAPDPAGGVSASVVSL